MTRVTNQYVVANIPIIIAVWQYFPVILLRKDTIKIINDPKQIYILLTVLVTINENTVES